MEYLKNLFVGLQLGIVAYLNPISGEIKSLLGVFVINFLCGLIAALLVNKESFNFKKAFRCVIEAMVFFLLVVCIYWIGEHKGNPSGALQCVSFITYSVFYFYGVNILRNIKLVLPNNSVGYRVVSFFYYVLSVEFIKNIPYLTAYLNKQIKEEKK
ncbi:MAG: phage holin family protein [Bacteroidaceae bacterium]